MPDLIEKKRKRIQEAIRREREPFALVAMACRRAFELRQHDARNRVMDYMRLYGELARSCADELWRVEYKRRARVMAAMLAEYENRNLNARFVGPSPFADVKPDEARAVARLYEAGHLSDDQVRAARRIARVYEAVSAAVMARSQSLTGARGTGHFNDLRLPEILAWDHATLYRPWADAMHKREDVILPLVIDVVALDVALDAARREHRIGFPKALRMVQDALDDFASRLFAEAIDLT